MQHKKDLKWLHIYNDNYNFLKSKIKGKYLFFSKHYESLVQIIEHEITEHGFIYGKVALIDTSGSGSLVMCLYWEDDSRLSELKLRYHDKIRWKSDEDTEKGVYTNRKETDSYLDLNYDVPFIKGYKKIFNNYYRTKFHDVKDQVDFNPDKIFDNVLEELVENFPEDILDNLVNMDLGNLPLKVNHNKVYIEDLKKKIME